MERIRERDDNFYRVMMQMEPMGRTQRLSGLENESRYGQLDKMGDADLIRKLTLQMNLMERQIFAQVQSFDQLREEIGKDKEKINHIPSIIPLNNRGFSLASGFGQRRDVITGQPKFHEGIDFAASSGTPIFATADGVVEVAERKPGFGNCIEINHGYNYLSRYAHLSEFMVEAGENVKRGQIIGRVGSSGVSTSPHLHYEVRFKGEAQNPVNYFFMDLDAHEFSEMIQKAENAGHIMD
ncbi:MAG: M23 family metallopeptidase [Muribaculaceae bacterium]|nr:M23 family metallopeptidase [Muribaculaceae bacterium]MDE6754569.1 M23 family metallopeptidase [Muribaculaceae bacterium]